MVLAAGQAFRLPSSAHARTALIAPAGVRPVAASVAKTGVTTLWYFAAVLPDAQLHLHRALYRKDIPAFHPGRILGILVSLGYASCLPVATGLRCLGMKKAGTVVASGVVANPPTILLTSMIFSEVVNKILRKFHRLAQAVLRIKSTT